MLQNVKKQRESGKAKAGKGKDEKEEETLKHEEPPLLRWGFFMAFLTKSCPPTEVTTKFPNLPNPGKVWWVLKEATNPIRCDSGSTM